MMLARYVLADLIRNPRRTTSTMAGVVLGVGLFCGVLFFVDGLSASMTQRAVEPLAIDMQRIVSQRAGAALDLKQSVVEADGAIGHESVVSLTIVNPSSTSANEVTVRSRLAAGLRYLPGSARVDGEVLADDGTNPFAHGAARAGYNLGTIAPGERHEMSYRLAADVVAVIDDTQVRTTYSTRETVNPIDANAAPRIALDELAALIASEPGVARAETLSIADLGAGALGAGGQTVIGVTKIFGFDAAYAQHDETIEVISGSLTNTGAVVSAEVARALDVQLGDTIAIELPDGSTIRLVVDGTADLTRSRALFSSRRGGDLETFVYTPNAVIVSPLVFATEIFPAYERTAAEGNGRLKAPPIREVDITLQRDLLDADPATAARQTGEIGERVRGIAAGSDYVLDNISNTLNVAADDAAVAKKLFVFLGVPGALLAAVLAAYAGNVLAEAQRREQATLRIRGASRRHLLRMLAIRTSALTATGALLGLGAGYIAAVAILGKASLERASAASLLTSATVGTAGGFLATGAALYVTGRRSIDHEIAHDRAVLTNRVPLWHRGRLDIIGLMIVVAGTAWALRTNAFAGASGSVYFGRSVELNLSLLALPVAVWITGSLAAARLIGWGLHRSAPPSSPILISAARALFRRSIGRRPWAIVNAAIVVTLIVGLAVTLTTFTASYDRAKVNDARYANGADIRITPSPTAADVYASDDAASFVGPGISETTPVIYGLSNTILRSARTSDPANVAAIDPNTYGDVVQLDDETSAAIASIAGDKTSVLLSTQMSEFLQAEVGDTLQLLLARATPDQAEIELTIVGLFERLPGFPEGADAVLDIAVHTAAVPAKAPDFFLAATNGRDQHSLDRAVAALRAEPLAQDSFQVDTRSTTFDRDQSSLAALNIGGLVELDGAFALGMVTVTVGIFVFGLLLQRRREYVTLRAQGVDARMIRRLIGAEAATVAIAGSIAGVVVGTAMGYYFVAVLRPLFVLDPGYVIPIRSVVTPVLLVLAATVLATAAGSRLINGLEPTELLRDD